MELLITLFKSTVLVFLGFIELSMFLRSILSWFIRDLSNKFFFFFYTVTEPVVIPVRMLCEKMHWFEGSLIDFPYMITFIIVIVVETALGAL